MRAVEPPVVLQVELTSRCNLRCEMCPLTTRSSSSSAHPGHMTDEVWERVLIAADWVGRAALAGFGEPFLDARCVDRLRALDVAGVELAIATNGTRITPSIAASLAALRHLIEINVSVDSADADGYAALRHGDLGRAVRGLALLAGALPPDRVLASVVLLSANAAALDQLPAMLRPLGVRRLHLAASHDYNDFAASHRLRAPVLDSVRRSASANGVAVELGNPVRTTAEVTGDERTVAEYFVPEPWPASATRRCFVPWEAPFVDKDGRVFACCFCAARDERPLGDVRTSGLADIWQGVEFSAFRRDLLDGATTPTPCRACTTVPIGTHPYAEWAAEVVDVVVGGGRATVRARNAGRVTWTHDDAVRIGTSRPLDAPDSALRSSTWLSGNRTCTFREESVPPGAIGTFAFDVSPDAAGYVRLVVDGRCWLPGTEVLIETTARPTRLPRRPWRSRRRGARARSSVVARRR